MVPFKTKWCDLEQKIVLFVNKTAAESQSDCGDRQWFQNGYYKSEAEAACRALQLATCTSSILIYLICPQNYRISIVFSFPQDGAVIPTWSRHQNNDYRYFLFGLKMTNIVILGHRQMTQLKSLSKVNRKGQGKYMLIWSIFPREDNLEHLNIFI